MVILGWTILIVLGYTSIAVWVANVARALRVRSKLLPMVLLAIPPLLWLVAVVLPDAVRAITAEALLLLVTLTAVRFLHAELPIVPVQETKQAALHLVLITGSALFLIPFAWMVATSLKPDNQLSAYPPQFIPHPVLWTNYPEALRYLPPGSHYGIVNLQNTLIIAALSVIGAVLSSSLVAYSFARLRWPGRDWVFGLLLATMMLPDAVTMMPRFLIFRSIHWVDTLLPLWAPSFFGSAFNIFLLRQFFMSIPQELEDAARIDGCSHLRIYWSIMMPLIKPAIAAVAIMTFLGAWKDFLNPLIYISSPEKMPLSYVLQLYNTAHGGEPQYLMAATTLVVLPVIILFFFTQRYFIEGVSFTGFGGR